MSVSSHDPDTTWPFDRTTAQLTCAPRGIGEQSTRYSTGRRRRTEPLCPLSVRRISPRDTSHTMSLGLSNDPPDTTWPLGRATTHETCAPRGIDEKSMRYSFGRRRRASCVGPRCTSHSVWRHSPLDTFQTLRALREDLGVISRDPDTMWPFGRTATHVTCARRGVDEQSPHDSTGRRRCAMFACPVSVRMH